MKDNWTTVITAKQKWNSFNFSELIQYKNLIWVFVKRNYSTRYKQTILGPLWLLITPIFTIVTYTIVFGGIAGLSTDGVPKPLFYLLGNIVWNFFAANVISNSNTFNDNVGVFGKIYFPRLVAPISITITNLFDFTIQFIMFFVMFFVYTLIGMDILFSWEIIFIPFLIFQLGILGIGVGIIISSLTTKYKDLNVLVGFGLNVWMYASPIIYSVSLVPEKLYTLFMLNPITPIILVFKKVFLGIGEIPYIYWGVSIITSLVILLIGLIIFNKVEKNFLDTV